MAKKRFETREIIDRILKTVENKENVMERTVEILKGIPNYDWVGIYLLEEEDLVLKYYIGRPTEHTRIKVGQGICGAAVVDEQTIIVSDVSSDERYIACSSETKSEMVVLIRSSGRIIGEIDIDSDLPCAFNSEDRRMVEMVADILGDLIAV